MTTDSRARIVEALRSYGRLNAGADSVWCDAPALLCEAANLIETLRRERDAQAARLEAQQESLEAVDRLVIQMPRATTIEIENGRSPFNEQWIREADVYRCVDRFKAVLRDSDEMKAKLEAAERERRTLTDNRDAWALLAVQAKERLTAAERERDEARAQFDRHVAWCGEVAEAAEARSTAYEAALKSIAANSCCAPCLEAGLVAQAALQPERCEGRYPVPQTSPPREEPFDVTYRCALPTGHDGPHGIEAPGVDGGAIATPET